MNKLIYLLFIPLTLFAVVETDTSVVSHDTQNSVLSYEIPFRFLKPTDLTVTLSSTSGPVTLVYGVDYTVSNNNILLSSLYESNLTDKTLVIVRTIDYFQERDWIEGGRFTAEEVESAFDKLTMLAQQNRDLLSEEQGFIVRFPVTETPTTSFLPAKAVRAGKYLKFDANGEFSTAVSVDLIRYRGAWATATSYLVGDVVYDPLNVTNFYFSTTVHESTSISADLTSGDIIRFFDLGDLFTRLQIGDVTVSSGWEFSEDDRLVPYAATELVTVSTDPNQGIKNNYEAIVAPTVNDDEGEDYSIGSMWIDTATNNVYTCTDATETAAVWKKISNETISPTSSIPAGMLAYFPIGTVPTGWLACDGTAYLKSAYADLYTALKDGGATCIYGEDATTFNVPDARGQFIRTYDGTAGVDPDKATRTDRGDGTIGNYVGTKQAEDFLEHDHGSPVTASSSGSHTHSGTTSTTGSHSHISYVWYWGGPPGTDSMIDRRDNTDKASTFNEVDIIESTSAGAHTHTFTTGTGGAHTHLITVESEGGNETRPVNISFQLCIKY